MRGRVEPREKKKRREGRDSAPAINAGGSPAGAHHVPEVGECTTVGRMYEGARSRTGEVTERTLQRGECSARA